MKNKFIRGKKLMAALLVGAMICSLPGCGKGGALSLLSTSKNPFEGKTELSKAMTVDAIWYIIKAKDGVGKDSEIKDVITINDGKINHWETDETLGELSKLSDEEIMEKLKEENSDSWERQIRRAVEYREKCQKFVDSGLLDRELTIFFTDGRETHEYEEGKFRTEKLDLTAFKPVMEKIISNMEGLEIEPDVEPTYKISATTDKTGNTIESELFRIEGLPGCGRKYIGKSAYHGIEEFIKDIDSVMEGLKLDEPIENAKLDFFIGSGSGKSDPNYVVTPNPDEYYIPYNYPLATAVCDNEIVGSLNEMIEVYDSKYCGFACDRDYCMITRTKDKVDFTLDSVDAEGIEID